MNKVINWLALNVFGLIISFVYNCVFWLFHLNKLNSTKKKMNSISNLDTRIMMNKFKWVKDKFDWTPWALTIFYKQFNDDCDGASALGRWSWKQQGIKSTIYSLKTDTKGHSVCVRDDHTQFISNNEVIDIDPNIYWEFAILHLGNTGSYDYMIKRWW